MKEKVIISTGGSGGHVIPATILYDHLSKEANVFITIDKRGLKYLDQTIYKFDLINTPKLSNIFFLPFNVIVILFLIFKSFFLLKNKKIEKIFSTGGYMSLPLILAAKLLKIQIFLIEPNQVLGRANRYFLKSCKKLFTKAARKTVSNPYLNPCLNCITEIFPFNILSTVLVLKLITSL